MALPSKAIPHNGYLLNLSVLPNVLTTSQHLFGSQLGGQSDAVDERVLGYPDA